MWSHIFTIHNIPDVFSLNNSKLYDYAHCIYLDELEQNVKLLKRMIDSNQYLQTQNENEAGKVRCEMGTDTDNDI
jgi:hypothetical protein